jgi:hypothetical protein
VLYFSSKLLKDIMMMTKLLFPALLGFALLSLTGCGEEKKPDTPAMKCEAGKCGAAMEKDATPTTPESK